MKVCIMVEFEVEPMDCDDGDEFGKQYAEAAAEQAVFDYLAFTKNGRDVVDSVQVHADGWGKCLVRLVE